MKLVICLSVDIELMIRHKVFLLSESRKRYITIIMIFIGAEPTTHFWHAGIQNEELQQNLFGIFFGFGSSAAKKSC